MRPPGLDWKGNTRWSTASPVTHPWSFPRPPANVFPAMWISTSKLSVRIVHGVIRPTTGWWTISPRSTSTMVFPWSVRTPPFPVLTVTSPNQHCVLTDSGMIASIATSRTTSPPPARITSRIISRPIVPSATTSTRSTGIPTRSTTAFSH